MDDMTRQAADEREARDARGELGDVPRDAGPRSPDPAADPAAGRARPHASGRAPRPNPGRATGATAGAPPEPRDPPVDGQLDGLYFFDADEQGEPIDDDRLPPRLRTAVSMILASGEAGAEEVVRGLVEVHLMHRALWEAARSQVSTWVARHRASDGSAAGIPRSPGVGGPEDLQSLDAEPPLDWPPGDHLMPEMERCLAGLLAGRETAAELVRRTRPRSYGGFRGRADLGGPEPDGGGVAPEESPAAPPDPPADGEPADLGDDEPVPRLGAPEPELPPRLREAIALILESGEIGAERVARLLVAVFRILRRLDEVLAADERDAAADPARSGVEAELAPSDAEETCDGPDDDGLPIAVRESIAGLLEGRETVAEYVARGLARLEDTAQQADADDLDDGAADEVDEGVDIADGGAVESSGHEGEESDIGDPETEPADPGARGEPEEPGAAGPGERLDPPRLDDLPLQTRALVANVLACGRPGSVEVAHALVDLYHAALGIDEGAGPAPDGEAGALGLSDPGGGGEAPPAGLRLPDDLPPRLRQFLEELSASGHPAAATIVRAATRVSEAMRRCPGLPPAPFDQDLEPADQEPEDLEAPDLEPEDIQPEDLVIEDTVALEAGSEGLPPDCLGYLHVKTEFRFEGGLFALATRSPEVVVGALRAMVRRATDRMLGAAAGELMERLPPDAVMKTVPQLLRPPKDFTWQ